MGAAGIDLPVLADMGSSAVLRLSELFAGDEALHYLRGCHIILFVAFSAASALFSARAFSRSACTPRACLTAFSASCGPCQRVLGLVLQHTDDRCTASAFCSATAVYRSVSQQRRRRTSSSRLALLLTKSSSYSRPRTSRRVSNLLRSAGFRGQCRVQGEHNPQAHDEGGITRPPHACIQQQ